MYIKILLSILNEYESHKEREKFMVKRDISQLTIYPIDEEVDNLPMKCLRRLYLEKPSEIIYVTMGKKLYGIICMREVLYGKKEIP